MVRRETAQARAGLNWQSETELSGEPQTQSLTENCLGGQISVSK